MSETNAENRKRRRKRRRKRSVARRLLRGFLLLCGAVLIGFLLWEIFQIREIEVTGNAHDTDRDIEAKVTEGPLGSNALCLFLYYRNRRIREDGFIDRISVRIKKPSEIVIEVSEKTLIGCVRYEGKYWYFDRDGTVEAVSEDVRSGYRCKGEVCEPDPENGTARGADYIPLAEGLAFSSVALGTTLPAESGEAFTDLESLKEFVMKTGLEPDGVAFDSDQSMILTFGDARVNLGKGEYVSLRLEKMRAIYPHLQGLSGVLHLESFDGTQDKIIFSKDENLLAQAS